MRDDIAALHEKIGALHDRVGRLVKVVEGLELRHENAVDWLRREMVIGDDKRVEAEYAIVALAFSTLKAFADTAGWSDDDIAAFLLNRAEEVRASEASAKYPDDATAGRLSALFEEAAVILRVPQPG